MMGKTTDLVTHFISEFTIAAKKVFRFPEILHVLATTAASLFNSNQIIKQCKKQYEYFLQP